MLRWISLLLIVLLLALQWKLWFGDGSMREVSWLRAKVGEQRAANAKLGQRNEALSAEIEDLKRGREAIEGRARAGLGLIKPGEMFYQVVEPANAQSGGADDK